MFETKVTRLFKWDIRHLRAAKEAARNSKDPSTKTGAVIVDKNNYIVATGYNGFPRKVADTPDRLNNRELKYKMVVHCERNAEIAAKRDLDGCTLYTWPFMSCAPCAGHMLQSGITRFVAPANDNPRWQADFNITREMIQEADAELVEIADIKKYIPDVVVLCGSTKFKDTFVEVNKAETLAGKVVLAPGVFIHQTGEMITEEQKAALDVLHYRKIDLADEVLVLNVGGYIGESTRNEIEYAKSVNVPIRYYEPIA